MEESNLLITGGTSSATTTLVNVFQYGYCIVTLKYADGCTATPDMPTKWSTPWSQYPMTFRENRRLRAKHVFFKLATHFNLTKNLDSEVVWSLLADAALHITDPLESRHMFHNLVKHTGIEPV